MKSLQESLFDTDLVEKTIDFGSMYKIRHIDISWSDYYALNGDMEDDKILISKMFKLNKLKGIKPVEIDKDMVWIYNDHLEIYEPLAQILTLVNKFTYIPYPEKEGWWEPKFGFEPKEYKNQIKTLLPYFFANTNIEIFRRNFVGPDELTLRIEKSFGSKSKSLGFVVEFIKK